jgi:hypothetical protein
MTRADGNAIMEYRQVLDQNVLPKRLELGENQARQRSKRLIALFAPK